MRRRVGLAGILIVVLAAGLVVIHASRPQGLGTHQAMWQVAGVTRDQRSIRIAIAGGGCDRHPRVKVAEEARRTVRLDVRYPTTRAHEACYADLLILPATVHLSAPLRGRRVLGGRDDIGSGHPLSVGFARRGDRVIYRVPRIAGLNVSQARDVLHAYGMFESRGSARRGVVTSTGPRAGTLTTGDVQIFAR